MTVNKERVELFARALESDKYHQCRGRLRSVNPFGGMEFNCALGVATHVALNNGLRETLKKHHFTGEQLEDYLFSGGTLDDLVQKWYGFEDNDVVIHNPRDGEVDSVPEVNDEGFNFWTIAQAIRAQYLKDEG